MNTDWKNTSTVYLQQHSRYYQWVLYPVILLFLGVLLFLFFGSSEQVVRSKAKLSAETITPVQIPIEASIKKNNLKENLKVQKGDILLVFDVEPLTKQKEQILDELATTEEKNKMIDLFIQSLEQEKNLFTQEDSYGYSNQVTAFLKGKEQTMQANQQVNKNYQANKQSAAKNREQLMQQITKNQSKIQELKQIRTAWDKQQAIANYSEEYLSKYSLWQLQMKQAQENEKEQVKATVLTEIDQLITQLQETNDQLAIQKEAIEDPVEPTGELNSQLAVVDQTKEQQIATAKEQQKELMSEKEKNEVTLKSVESDLQSAQMIAPVEGTIHLRESYEKVEEIPKGTVIAEIYETVDQNTLTVVSQISADEMTPIKVGMPIHMKLDKKGVSEQVLDGTVTEISETSTTTEAGTFFVVKGKIKNKQKAIRYGLTGDISFVTGKKTYWDQLISFMFNKE